MSVDLVAIDNICELVRGSSPRPQGDPRYFGGSVPRLMVADMTRDGMYVTPSIDSLTEEGAKQSRPMKAGEVVMVVSGLVGLPSILKIDACIHDGLVGFRNLDKNVMPEYLYYWLLKSQEITRTQTAGAIWQNLTTDQIKEWKLPLPPLTEQKRIASLLARADRLRHLRRTAHELGESLLQSVFLEMFGDPKFNEKKWQLELGEELFKKIGYGVGTPPPFIDKGNIFLRAMNIKPSGINLNKVVYFSSEYEKEMSRSKVKAGDVVVVRRGANTGDTALIPPELDGAYVGYDLILHPDETKMLGVYFVKLMNTDHFRSHIYQIRERAAQQGLNAEQIGELVIPVPPLSKQEEFAGVVARVESLRGRMSEGERQVEGLFESLLAEAFNG